MARFVKKGAFGGYGDVPGGQSDPECTHVILSLKEYERLIQEKDQALRNVEIEKRTAKDEIDKANRANAYQLQQEKEAAAVQVQQAEEELDEAREDVAYQRQLNETLLRIARERANADRGLKPKKDHTGYVVLSSGEKELRRKESKRSTYYYVKLWETVLQTPYSVDFSEEQARRQICEDLMECEDGEDWMLARIGIYKMPEKISRYLDDDKLELGGAGPSGRNNVLLRYRLRANYQARRDKETGFWEIILTHKEPLSQVPRDMRCG